MSDILSAFKKVGKIVEASWASYFQSPEEMSVDDLSDLVAETFSFKIEMRLVQFEGRHISGMIERYKDGRAIIYIRNDLSEQDRRHVAVKELCHLIIDEPSDFNPDGLDTLERLLLDDPTDTTASLQSEKTAWIMVHELLYPHELRRADLAALQAGTVTVEALVLRYNVPDWVVRRVLHKRYLDACDHIWSQCRQGAASASPPTAAA